MYSSAFSRQFIRSLASLTTSSLGIINTATGGASTMPVRDLSDNQPSSLCRHPQYWLDDGSLVVSTQDYMFKVHRSLLQRHSIGVFAHAGSPGMGETTIDGCPVLHIPEDRVSSADLEALFAHLYHDHPLDADAPLSRIAAVLRASSKRQLDFPVIHRLARQRLVAIFPSGPEAFFHPDNPDEALTLAVEFDVYSIQKALFYSIATNSNLEHDEPEGAGLADDGAPPRVATPDGRPRPNLSPELEQRCKTLLTTIVDYFTPILFTVATAHHMACTDVFAEEWMPRVIAPALASDGLCRPLETLETIIALDWAAHGLCADCVRDKREEWREEQRAFWDKMDEWLGLVGKDKF
ncbi:hypothetical protein B0H21DRAFT_775595 [Amylocystis lapponica]|nr:hypothetical protein B0H21DRAFT_775595 [Amylocystis lapponica]